VKTWFVIFLTNSNLYHYSAAAWRSMELLLHAASAPYPSLGGGKKAPAAPGAGGGENKIPAGHIFAGERNKALVAGAL
jgi:hypothetical protein